MVSMMTPCQCWHQWCHMIKKSCWALFWISWPVECDSVIDDVISIMWCWHWCQWCHMTKKSCCTWFQSSWPEEYSGIIDDASACGSGVSWPNVILHIISIALAYGMQWCHWWHQHPCQCHHMTKSHMTPHFNHVDVKNGMLWLMMLSPSCEGDVSTNGITWPKELCCIWLWLSWPKEYSCIIDDANGIS